MWFNPYKEKGFNKIIRIYIRKKALLEFVPEYVRKVISDSFINTLILWVTLKMVSGIYGPESFTDIVLIAAFYSVITSIARPVFLMIFAPLILFSLGSFIMIINILMLYLTAWSTDFFNLHFHISSIYSATVGGVLISLFHYVFKRLRDTVDSHITDIGDRDWIMELEWGHSHFTREGGKYEAIANERESVVQKQKAQIKNLKRELAIIEKKDQD
ncbi:MAG: phage holin family protein [Thermodesulfobacteriota bacterium]